LLPLTYHQIFISRTFLPKQNLKADPSTPVNSGIPGKKSRSKQDPKNVYRELCHSPAVFEYQDKRLAHATNKVWQNNPSHNGHHKLKRNHFARIVCAFIYTQCSTCTWQWRWQFNSCMLVNVYGIVGFNVPLDIL